MNKYKFTLSIIVLAFFPLIVNCQDTRYNFKKVYVSSSIGNDSNDGLTEKTALRTINKALSLADTVLLKAGDVFYEYCVLKRQYMSYYGEGNKPELNGMRILKGSPWQKESGNIWCIDLTSLDTDGFNLKGSTELNNVGCLYEIDKDALHGRKCAKKEDLLHNWDFYQASIKEYNAKKNSCFDILYLYYDGDPNKLYLSLSVGSHYGIELHDSSVDNLKVIGFGTGGMTLYGSSNVRNCRVDAVGGSMMLAGNTTVSLGNGIDFWLTRDAYDCIIEGNYITRCYDCGCSIQGNGHGQATPRNITFRHNFISNCCQGWEDFLRNDDNVKYENCVFENNVVVEIGETSGFGYSDGRFKYCHVLGNNYKGNKGMIIRNNLFVGGNFYCSGAYNEEYKSNVWEGNVCIIKRGDFILSNVVGSKDVIRIPRERGNYRTLKEATDVAIQQYRELTGDRTTHFVIKSEKSVERRIKKEKKTFQKSIK